MDRFDKAKRLLILGGQQKLCDIVLCAKQMGIYTIVTDWYEDSPAKKIADKSFMVSTSDVEGILKLIQEEHIDGIITGYIDSTLPYYYEICQKAGFPCYLNQQTLACCTNKRKFKAVCARLGIETIPEVDINDRGSLDYPILIKPVDNSGSKGITVCYQESMIDSAVDRALRFSKSKDFLSEQFLVCDYVAAYYTVQNGKVELMLLMDKEMNRVARGVVPYPVAMTVPSRYHESFCKEMDSKIAALVAHLGIENGTFEIGFFVNGSHYYAVELTARLTATREYIFIRDMFGMDTLKMYIQFAISGNFYCEQREQLNQQYYCMLFAFLTEGYIGNIIGLDNVAKLDGVLDVLQTRDVGAKIRADGSYGQLFAKVYLKTESRKQMIELINDVQKNLRVYSEDGYPMLVTGFHANHFL